MSDISYMRNLCNSMGISCRNKKGHLVNKQTLLKRLSQTGGIRGIKMRLAIKEPKSLDQLWNEYGPILDKYYNTYLPDLATEEQGKLIGRGANKMAYMYGDKYVALMPISGNFSQIANELEIYLSILPTYFTLRPSFVLPKVYRTLDQFQDKLIMDYIPCSSSGSKTLPADKEMEIKDFFAKVGINPIDIEACVDQDGTVYVYDLGSVKKLQ